MVALAILEYAGILYAMRFTTRYREEAIDADNVSFRGSDHVMNIGQRHNMENDMLHGSNSLREESPEQIKGTKGPSYVPQKALMIDHYSLVLFPICLLIIAVIFFAYYCTVDI